MTTLSLEPSGVPTPSAGPVLAPPDPAVLERNLAALARSSPLVAELVRSSAPRTDLRFLRTDDGVPSIEVVDVLGLTPPRALASRRRPVREGEQLADAVEVATTAAAAVMGFGAGYHVGALARRMKRSGVIAVFEPDIGLLRAVLERTDHSEWLLASNTAIFTDPDDAAAISTSLVGVEGIVMMGLALLEHAPSLDRLGAARTRFYKNLQDVIAAIRTTVATTMVQVRTTVSNVTRNLGWYVSSPGVADLAGSWAGRPAIVVSAGPSLQRNIEQLTRPGVRDRFVIVAAQTVLKPLLARGIKPHYVVALDHSEISARFYEGLSAADVEGVTLVVEPKVSPAVPLAFPGAVRLARDAFLDMLLGEHLARDMGSLPPGATVAHLAYYLARHLGADPVVLVGQDLGFTDGQYYAAGAAIHNVWACELNQFNSLERMEWERIKRMGAHLRRATDQQARPIYTDEQLATYLVQFERDFLADTHRGLSIIDATEGGIPKRHTRAVPLRDVVDGVLARGPEPDQADGSRETPTPPRVGIRRAEERVRDVAGGVHRVGELSRRTAELLGEMLANHADQRRVSRLIDEVHRVRDEAEATSPGMELVHYVNQAGAFARLRADRSIHLDNSLTPLERQRREIERDLANVELLARTADELAVQLGEAAGLLSRWRDDRRTPQGSPGAHPSRSQPTDTHAAAAGAHAVVTIDPERLAAAGDWTLRLTLGRLARCQHLRGVVLLGPQAEQLVDAVRRVAPGFDVRAYVTDAVPGGPVDRIRAARAPAMECWRAGLGGASVYDEALAPEATLAAMDALAIDTVLVLRHDWCAVDPGVCDRLIERACRASGTHRLAFSQAPPGAAGVVVNRAVVADLVRLRRGSSDFATLGGLLSYVPSAPALDPIGKEPCVAIDPALRDCGRRLVPDSPWRLAAMRAVVEEHGAEAAAALGAGELAALFHRRAQRQPEPPSHLTVEAGDTALAATAAEQFATASPGGLLTLRIPGHQLAAAHGIAERVRTRGLVCLHVRTDLSSDAAAEAAAALHADIISVDLPVTTDRDEWDGHHRRLTALEGSLRSADGRSRAWLVPRLRKCDATYDVMEGVFDRWMLTTGAAAIDTPHPTPDQRISPLPLPAAARRRFDRTAMYIRGDGSVHPGDVLERGVDGAVAHLPGQSFDEAWTRTLAARTGCTP